MAKIDILIPTYNGAKYIIPTIKSILSQKYQNFRIIVCDDASTDKTTDIIKKIDDPRILIKKHTKNLGYSQNLERGRQYVIAPILYLMGQDDIMAQDTLQDTVNAFKNPKIGAVTRPYFWFDKDIKIPVRAKKALNLKKNTIVKITDSQEKVIRVFETLDQLSGLAYRTKFIETPFHPDIFPCHIYPFAQIFRDHPIVFLKNYNIAVRIASSQTRTLSSIYQKSPILSWIQMVQVIFSKTKYQKIKKYLIKNFITKNYVGLVQIRNYAKYSYLLRESFYLIKYNYQNLISLKFWFFSLGCLLIPPQILIPSVDFYKNKILSRSIPRISFQYKI